LERIKILVSGTNTNGNEARHEIITSGNAY